MDNIEILEELIEASKEYNQYNGNKYYKVIENLIKENKKLKKQMDKDLDVVYIKGVYDERDRWKNKVKEKIEILEKCTTKIDKKVNLTDYMIIGQTERAVGRFVNLDFIKKVLLDEPGYNIELLEDKYIKGCLEYANNIEDNEYDTEE